MQRQSALDNNITSGDLQYAAAGLILGLAGSRQKPVLHAAFVQWNAWILQDADRAIKFTLRSIFTGQDTSTLA